jgi:hypothetical protein
MEIKPISQALPSNTLLSSTANSDFADLLYVSISLRCLQELFPGGYCPTPAHFFLKLLHDKGLLLSAFTQNIDGLEQLAGLPGGKVVPAHGSFDGDGMLGMQGCMLLYVAGLYVAGSYVVFACCCQV